MKLKKVTKGLRKAGAINVDVGKFNFRNFCRNFNARCLPTEFNIKPTSRTLQFFVKDEAGTLAEALKTFRVSAIWLRYKHYMSMTHNSLAA